MVKTIESAISKTLVTFNKVKSFISEHQYDAEEIYIYFFNERNDVVFEIRENCIETFGGNSSTSIEDIDIDTVHDLRVSELLSLLDAIEVRIFDEHFSEINRFMF